MRFLQHFNLQQFISCVDEPNPTETVFAQQNHLLADLRPILRGVWLSSPQVVIIRWWEHHEIRDQHLSVELDKTIPLNISYKLSQFDAEVVFSFADNTDFAVDIAELVLSFAVDGNALLDESLEVVEEDEFVLFTLPFEAVINHNLEAGFSVLDAVAVDL